MDAAVGAGAAATDRAELGTIVLGTGFRPPALTAKMAATLDEIANGRLILGLGTGWHEPEYAAFGYPFDHRAGRFEEALEIIVPLLRGERVTFHGRWHDVDDAVLIPPPAATRPPPGSDPDPDRRQGRAHPAPGRAPRRRLERGLVRLPRRALRRSGARTSWPPARPRAATRRRSRSRSGSPSMADRRTAAVRARPGRCRPTPTPSPARFDAWRDLGVAHVQVDLRPADERLIDVLVEAPGAASRRG